MMKNVSSIGQDTNVVVVVSKFFNLIHINILLALSF
jgi:hypothetical protein